MRNYSTYYEKDPPSPSELIFWSSTCTQNRSFVLASRLGTRDGAGFEVDCQGSDKVTLRRLRNAAENFPTEALLAGFAPNPWLDPVEHYQQRYYYDNNLLHHKICLGWSSSVSHEWQFRDRDGTHLGPLVLYCHVVDGFSQYYHNNNIIQQLHIHHSQQCAGKLGEFDESIVESSVLSSRILESKIARRSRGLVASSRKSLETVPCVVCSTIVSIARSCLEGTGTTTGHFGRHAPMGTELLENEYGRWVC